MLLESVDIDKLDAKISQLEKDGFSKRNDLTESKKSIDLNHKNIKELEAKFAEVNKRLESEFDSWMNDLNDFDAKIVKAKKTVTDITELELNPKTQDLKHSKYFTAEVSVKIGNKGKENSEIIDDMKKMLTPEDLITSHLPELDEDAYAFYFAANPNVHAVITALIIILQYVRLDGLTNLINFSRAAETHKISQYFKKDGSDVINTSSQSPSWCSTWLQPHAKSLLLSLFDLSLSTQPKNAPSRSDKESVEKPKLCATTIEWYVNREGSINQSWYVNRGGTSSQSWNVEVGKNCGSIMRDKVYSTINRFGDDCCNVESESAVSELVTKTINLLKPDGVTALLILSGLVLDNTMVVVAEKFLRFMQNSIKDESEKDCLQWAISNKYNPDTNQSKQPNIHENFALSQLFAEWPLWMDLNHYLTFTSLLSDPLTFIGKLPLLFSWSPILLPLSQGSVQVLIRQGLHTLEPYLIPTGEEQERVLRCDKYDLRDTRFMDRLSNTMLEYLKAMRGPSTEHEVSLYV